MIDLDVLKVNLKAASDSIINNSCDKIYKFIVNDKKASLQSSILKVAKLLNKLEQTYPKKKIRRRGKVQQLSLFDENAI